MNKAIKIQDLGLKDYKENNMNCFVENNTIMVLVIFQLGHN